MDPAGINRIDGDVRDLTERRQILQRTRLALMTPDVIQQWLMAYSEPLYGRRPLRHDLREVQNTQYNVRRFLSNLAFLILDEAHIYDGALGTHCLYLLHRLQQKRRELMAEFEPLRMIAASATIHNPAQHLETLTGLPFQVVDDRYDGSPRAQLTVRTLSAGIPTTRAGGTCRQRCGRSSTTIPIDRTSPLWTTGSWRRGLPPVSRPPAASPRMPSSWSPGTPWPFARG